MVRGFPQSATSPASCRLDGQSDGSFDAQLWRAVLDRTGNADGKFVYGVKTTGVYCRPTCPSRRPKPENVLFFESSQAAEMAGFRPCKRCQPQAVSPQIAQAETMVRLCKFIEAAETVPSLQALADQAGLSPYHLQRQFKKIIGVTPKQYATAHRTQQLRQQLRESNEVTTAIYEAGFESSSSFYRQSTALLGMTPTQYRQGALGISVQYVVQPCWLGWVLVAATPQGICAIALGDQEAALVEQLQQDFPQAQVAQAESTFQNWVTQVLSLIETPQQAITVPLDIRGTVFQQQVWQALQTIPPGTTVSYGDVARRLGNPKAVRAVAQACSRNRLAVVIPCHRVVGRDGTLRGYRWGCDRKQALLNREATMPEDT